MRESSLFSTAKTVGEDLPLPDGTLVLYRQPDLGPSPAELFTLLNDTLAWRQESITLFGRRMLQPRLLAWYGDPQAVYRYSGQRHEPLPWSAVLGELRMRVEAITGARFNSVLANLYRDHRDSMGLHADDEPELGERPVIASLSLGDERIFRLKHRQRRDLKPVRIPLTDGSLLVMAGDTQRHWKHEVPKQTRPCGPRINLTFRWVGPRYNLPS
jgi:alkylated DNA repair dioxygenase AlkB